MLNINRNWIRSQTVTHQNSNKCRFHSITKPNKIITKWSKHTNKYDGWWLMVIFGADYRLPIANWWHLAMELHLNYHLQSYINRFYCPLNLPKNQFNNNNKRHFYRNDFALPNATKERLKQRNGCDDGTLPTK